MCFRGKIYGRKQNEVRTACYNGVYINLYDRLGNRAGRGFIKNRPPYRLGFEWMG
jgi:hypothetical protein